MNYIETYNKQQLIGALKAVPYGPEGTVIEAKRSNGTVLMRYTCRNPERYMGEDSHEARLKRIVANVNKTPAEAWR